MAIKKRGLGKGLDALLNSAGNPTAILSEDSSDEIHELPLEKIQRGRYQPRKTIDNEALKDLANSIKQQGLMQPIIVRPIGDSHYEIIAGERRWQACKSIGYKTVSAIVREVKDDAAIAMALIENLQREDLNPIEEAEAFHRLQTEFNLTQEGVARAVGKSRSTIANILRLNSLEPEVKSLLQAGQIEMGHAKAILVLSPKEQIHAAATVVKASFSVRQTERFVRDLLNPPKRKKELAEQADPDVERLKAELSEKLGAKVEIIYKTSGRGRVQISYNSLDELEGILSHLKG